MVQTISGMGQRGAQNGKLRWEVISSPVEASSYQQAPRRGEPTHQDRQHHGFQFFTSLVFFSCVSVFFQVLSGSASSLKWPERPLLLLSNFSPQTDFIASTRHVLESWTRLVFFNFI